TSPVPSGPPPGPAGRARPRRPAAAPAARVPGGAEGGASGAVPGAGHQPGTGALRRLLPRALVLAVLAGGTTAFLAADKEVRLAVDGDSRTLHTFAGDVGALLDEEGLLLGPHDTVSPPPAAALDSGDRVEVRAPALVLTLDGRRRTVWTTAATVDEALRTLGVPVDGHRRPPARTPIPRPVSPSTSAPGAPHPSRPATGRRAPARPVQRGAAPPPYRGRRLYR
ncbi:ubiquitin-like domain-containing protein, partial [Schaalia naturae]